MNIIVCQIKKINIIFAWVFAAALSLPEKILAQPTFTTVSPPDPNNFNVDNMLGTIRNYFFGIVIITCVFMVLWGGFDLATSGGDETKVSNARKRILYATVGLVVAAMASVIVGLMRVVVGF